MPITEPTVPVGWVQAFVGLALNKGWDIEEMLRSAEISLELIAEGRSRVTVGQAAELFRQLWRQTDDELFDFGLQPVPRGTFRMLCFALLSAPDLHTTLRRYDEFKRAMPGFPKLRLAGAGPGRVRLAFDISAVEVPVDVLVVLLLAATHRFLGWAIGKRIPLEAVEVPYGQRFAVDDYNLIFGAPVRFSAPDPALVFHRDILSARIVRDVESLEEFLHDSPIGILTHRDYRSSIASQVREILDRGPAGHRPTVSDIAGELAVSPQTLRRKLRDEGTSAREIKEQVLRDAAIASLVRGEETVTALSRRLGFSEPSAFSRAFRRWTGSPPGSYQP